MIFDDTFCDGIAQWFQPLATGSAANSFPSANSLRDELERILPDEGMDTRNVTANVAAHYCTAATDMWHRSVHSFLVSASLTKASPIWASVSGYYASHYAVRAIAHSLGHFQLFRRKRLVTLRRVNNRLVCTFTRKQGNDQEHKLYWKLVKESGLFQSDDFFTDNDPSAELSDIRHRNHANYSDHLVLYPTFVPLDMSEIKRRVEVISKISFDIAPLPRFSEFPDIDNVQVVAYHRLVRFRRLVDQALSSKNNFWNKHRNPSFALTYLDYQLTEGRAGLRGTFA